MREPPPVDELLASLASFADELKVLLHSSDVDWHWTAIQGEWNLTQVMCHLRDVELEVHQPRFQALIASDNSFLPGVDADEWAEPREYAGQNGIDALHKFIEARRSTIELLADLDETLWNRRGRHAFFGFTTLHELFNLVKRHDDAHREQIVILAIGQD